jgi:DNA-binding NarL/FixJ family response regulator
MPHPIRVLLVDDHEVFVDALAICLGDYPDLAVTGVATSLEAGLALLEDVGYDVIVLDLDLQGEDGLAIAREALRRDPRVGIVVATGAEANDQIVEAVQMGVRGWVAKTVTAEALVEAVRGVARGETRIPADLLAEVLVAMSRGQRTPAEHTQGISDLTSRELEVLGCLVEGMSRTEIGELLHVSPNTVRTHVQSILHKLKVHSALAAVAIARRAGVTGARALTL